MGKFLVTIVTGIRFFSSMSPFMGLSRMSLSKFLVTIFTSIFTITFPVTFFRIFKGNWFKIIVPK